MKYCFPKPAETRRPNQGFGMRGMYRKDQRAPECDATVFGHPEDESVQEQNAAKVKGDVDRVHERRCQTRRSENTNLDHARQWAEMVNGLRIRSGQVLSGGGQKRQINATRQMKVVGMETGIQCEDARYPKADYSDTGDHQSMGSDLVSQIRHWSGTLQAGGDLRSAADQFKINEVGMVKDDSLR